MRIYMIGLILLTAGIVAFVTGKKSKKKTVSTSIVQQVDALKKQLNSEISEFEIVASLDHHRMAEKEGVYTPPAIATVFSDPLINSRLLAVNQEIGLDLPFKVLVYSEPDTSSVRLAYTSSEFIQKRHGLEKPVMEDYSKKLDGVIQKFPQEMVSESNIDPVSIGFGIVKIQSDFDFETTREKVKKVVMSQSDTKWFGDIDFQNQAKSFDFTIRPTVLLLFGGPAPGGKAMMTSPKIGLDAFCQKLLVYQDDSDRVWVMYNDIVAFAELYYQTSTKPQHMINERLKMTFTKAVKK